MVSTPNDAMKKALKLKLPQTLEEFANKKPQAPAQSAAVAASKWIGIVKGGPRDLSINPVYMKDFGR
jgi:hypothetical protein